jgi:bifunctional non-homologous end joining protein LigD
MLRMRTLPAGFIAPCLPTKTDTLPSGGLWIHEIKHEGFRIIARKDGERVTLYSRPGNDFTRRFPPIARALTHLRCRSCIIDGEAVICDDNGVHPSTAFAIGAMMATYSSPRSISSN